ncbi:uncharacterized protein C2orf92-like isoform X2 [Castor canadensis]|uniref:Uncharacterized protein C2orf92-like isoform X2 n=1 Tax=Castor canadensis TaxID=51338 RepID=A0AC58KN85_CASCN
MRAFQTIASFSKFITFIHVLRDLFRYSQSKARQSCVAVLTSFVCFPGDEIEMQVLRGEYYPVLKYEGKTSPQLMTEGDADGGHLHPKTSYNSDFESDLNEHEEHLAKIFDKIVLEVFLAETYGKLKYKGGAPEQQITQTDADEGFSFVWNSAEHEYFLDAMNRILQNNWNLCSGLHSGKADDISEEKWVKEASVFNRNLRQQLTAKDKETPKNALNPDFQRKSPLCRVMLQFLQKNIIIAAITMTAIIVIMVLVLLFPVYMRRKQALHPRLTSNS